MADIKEGRKRVAVVDNLIKRLRASGELNIQPVRHFGPKYGQRHNPYANGVKKYELTGVGIYREDIACANTTSPTTTASSESTTSNSTTASTAGQKRQTSNRNSNRETSSSSYSRSGGQVRRSRRVTGNNRRNSNEFTYPASIVGDEMTSGDYLAADTRAGEGLLLGIGIENSCSSEEQALGADDLVDVVQGDKAGQSDMYLCRLDNGFAQETTLQ